MYAGSIKLTDSLGSEIICDVEIVDAKNGIIQMSTRGEVMGIEESIIHKPSEFDKLTFLGEFVNKQDALIFVVYNTLQGHLRHYMYKVVDLLKEQDVDITVEHHNAVINCGANGLIFISDANKLRGFNSIHKIMLMSRIRNEDEQIIMHSRVGRGGNVTWGSTPNEISKMQAEFLAMRTDNMMRDIMVNGDWDKLPQKAEIEDHVADSARYAVMPTIKVADPRRIMKIDPLS